MAAILFSKCPWQWQLFRNKMLEQIRDHWYKPPYPFFSVILIVLIKKLIKLSWNRFPVWGILWKNGSHFEQNGHHFLCRQKNITSNRTCTTLVLSSKFCTDIIFSLGNMKLFVSFFHITAVKRCHSQIVLNTNCTPTFMDS